MVLRVLDLRVLFYSIKHLSDFNSFFSDMHILKYSEPTNVLNNIVACRYKIITFSAMSLFNIQRKFDMLRLKSIVHDNTETMILSLENLHSDIKMNIVFVKNYINHV